MNSKHLCFQNFQVLGRLYSSTPALNREEVFNNLEKDAFKHHLSVCWIACVLNPIFSVTDYFNIPNYWLKILIIRIIASISIFIVIIFRDKFRLNSFTIIVIPFLLICFENTLIYSFIDEKHLEGHNLNFIAMFIASGMFLLWRPEKSLFILIPSWLLTFIFLRLNSQITMGAFLTEGGLLLLASGIFMSFLIHTRFNLTLRALLAQMQLKQSNEKLQEQAELIQTINDTLEKKVEQRTRELVEKNLKLEEHAFINSHKLRAPLANILGLTDLLLQKNIPSDDDYTLELLKKSSMQLDEIVTEINKNLKQ